MSDTYIWSVKHYVNNLDFFHALEEREQLVADAVANNKPIPPISNYIAECIVKICTHLSYKPNFNGYTFKDEFVADAIENCLKKVDKFKTSKSSNGFWYFTRIAHNQFIRRILIEREQSFIKALVINQLPFDLYDLEDQDSDTEYVNDFLKEVQQNGVFNGLVEKETIRRAKKKSQLPVKTPMVVESPLDMLFEDSE